MSRGLRPGNVLMGAPRGGKSSSFEAVTVALRACGGGRCRVEGAVVALCERHHAALVTGGAR